MRNSRLATESDLLGALETHSPDEIASVLAAGVSPLHPINGKTPIECLIESYLRSPRFADCLRVLLQAGADLGDPVLQALLLDDAAELTKQIAISPEALTRRFGPLTAFYVLPQRKRSTHLRRVQLGPMRKDSDRSRRRRECALPG